LGINDLQTDLQDGVVLHNLLEVLGNEDVLPRANKKAKLKLQKIENINTCLRYIKGKNINLVNIGAEGPCPFPPRPPGLPNSSSLFSFVVLRLMGPGQRPRWPLGFHEPDGFPARLFPIRSSPILSPESLFCPICWYISIFIYF